MVWKSTGTDGAEGLAQPAELRERRETAASATVTALTADLNVRIMKRLLNRSGRRAERFGGRCGCRHDPNRAGSVGRERTRARGAERQRNAGRVESGNRRGAVAVGLP